MDGSLLCPIETRWRAKGLERQKGLNSTLQGGEEQAGNGRVFSGRESIDVRIVLHW
jgi:hypothetical protein